MTRKPSSGARAEPDIGGLAAAIGQPARASMLSTLMDGSSCSVGELARRAGVSASTASTHLARLEEAGLVKGERRGREKHYQVAGLEVARALEALQRIAGEQAQTDLATANAREQLCFARTCYDHLAGRLGVAIAEAMLARGFLSERGGEFGLTESGHAWLRDLGIEPVVLRKRRRGFALKCLDWSECRPHLAGSVGAALLEQALGRGWVSRVRGTRALRLTEAGRTALSDALEIELVE